MNAKLVVLNGKATGREVPLPVGRFLIGRAPDCQLRPASDLVSRHHCALTVTRSTVRVYDPGSANGTFVNGQRVVGEMDLHGGDELTVGPLTFAVVVEQGILVGTSARARAHALPSPTGEPQANDAEVAEWLDSTPEPGPCPSVSSDTATAIPTLPSDIGAEPVAEEQDHPRKGPGPDARPPSGGKAGTVADMAGAVLRKYLRHSS